ncbi:hypothetical protein QBC45DRAFT_392583 [Copromyces sp. CBS 386.78]|nr:hypothetical protein QBC45DRAFT_392583 [Copromyces sp. CBS 386.78]
MTTTTTTKKTTTSTAGGGATPTPTQHGMVSGCKKFHKFASGDQLSDGLVPLWNCRQWLS